MFKPFQLSGIGLHSGVETAVKVMPADIGQGRYFIRVDLPGQPCIPASIESVVSTTLSTELANGNARVRTVEHLLCALVGCNLRDVRIEIDGPEVPLLDGSARLWVEAILNNQENKSPEESQDLGIGFSRPEKMVEGPVWARDGDAFVAALPASELVFSYGIDFPSKAIGSQWYSWHPSRESFARAIAPARTFGFAEQIEQLRSAGLIKGGSLDNALVCDRHNWLNPPLRFDNEPVRHKLLDLIGDLSLLGEIPQGHFLAYKASHQLHTELVRHL